MSNKQKLGYMIIGALIMLIGIGLGAIVSPPLIAQRNEVFDEIQCATIRIVDKKGKTAIFLDSSEHENHIKVYDKAGKTAILLDSTEHGNNVEVYDKAEQWSLRPNDGKVFKHLQDKSKRTGVIRVEDLVKDLNPNRVATDPSYSQFIQAYEDVNEELISELAKRATPLRLNLEFPLNTFAVDLEHGIVIAHSPDGSGVLIEGWQGACIMHGQVAGGWFTFEKRGDLRVLSHYAPNDR